MENFTHFVISQIRICDITKSTSFLDKLSCKFDELDKVNCEFDELDKLKNEFDELD